MVHETALRINDPITQSINSTVVSIKIASFLWDTDLYLAAGRVCHENVLVKWHPLRLVHKCVAMLRLTTFLSIHMFPSPAGSETEARETGQNGALWS